MDELGEGVLSALRTSWAVVYLRVDGEGRVIDSNPHTEALLGRPVKGVAFAELTTTYDEGALAARPLPDRRFLNFMVRGAPISVPCTLRSFGPETIVLGEGDGREEELLRQVVGLHRDLAERTRGLHRTAAQLTRLSDGQARTLRSIEERFTAFTGESSSGMAIASEDGALVFSNRALAVLCGRDTSPTSLHELFTAPWAELSTSIMPVVHQVGAWVGECSLRGPEGSSVEVELRVFDLKLHERPLLGLIMTDVGPYKRVERQLREALTAAETAMVTRARFVANISHELRTPLNAIIGLSELGLEAPGSTKDAHLAQIRAAADGLLGIVNEVLDFSKASAGHLVLIHAPFGPGELVHEVVALLRPGAEAKGLSLVETPNEAEPPWVLGDGPRVKQVLLNLVGNAIKFTDHGEARVRVRAEEAPPRRARLTFEVQDTGVGIDADLVPRLFQPFTQGDDSMTRRHGGTGLGLASSQQLIEAMGGHIACESKPSVGSVFRFSLTLDLADAPALKRPTPVPSFHGVRALVVDDNAVNQRVATGLLKKLGVAVSVAGNGLEAVEALRRGPQDFDVVLMDLQMPVMDGFTATRAIRQELGLEVPVIALTAHGWEEERAQGLAAGMNDHLTKPARLAALGTTLARWVRHSTGAR